jgi:segregation and condensation protein B
VNLINAIEAILFCSGRPLSFRKIGKIANCSESMVAVSLSQLANRYADSGISLHIANQKAQLVSNPEYADIVKPLIRKPAKRRLSSAHIEVLAVIASKGEATLTQINKYRGSSSDSTIRGLQRKGLLERVERQTKNKRKVITFKVTPKFRELAGLSQFEELKSKLAFLDGSSDIADGNGGNEGGDFVADGEIDIDAVLADDDVPVDDL